ncbi:DUF3035 domain-containing protein [Candidatus Pelagibacter sp.]|nr:DUF3035 domain-containing protein [Candidatus Pelagibacter sp.]
MKNNFYKTLLLMIILPLMTYCGDVRDALEGKKRSEQNDEFLVKKKNPLQMPPDMNKLPKPGDDVEKLSPNDNNEVKDLLKIKENNNTEDTNSNSDLLNNMKKKIQ